MTDGVLQTLAPTVKHSDVSNLIVRCHRVGTTGIEKWRVRIVIKHEVLEKAEDVFCEWTDLPSENVRRVMSADDVPDPGEVVDIEYNSLSEPQRIALLNDVEFEYVIANGVAQMPKKESG